MKKILHISKYYFPYVGGTEKVAQDCVEILKNDYKQKVICFNDENKNIIETIDGIEVIRCATFCKFSSQSLSFTYGKILKDTIKCFNPDIIVFHYPNPFVAYYLLKYINKNTKLVLYWHLDIVKQKILKLFFNKQNNILIKRANVIIGTSPNYIEGSEWLKKVKNKCIVVPNCINENNLKITNITKKLVEKIKIDNKNKCICFAVGRHTEYKGFEYLIKAFYGLDDRYVLYIAGKGELTSKLIKLSKKCKNIHIIGIINNDELVAYLNACDIFCFSSISKNEAFGIALAEAMYCRKPSITFKIPGSGVNYVSIKNVTGIEVENKNINAYRQAIIDLYNDKKLMIKYGENAKNRVIENFMYERFKLNIKNVFDKL